MAWVGPLHVGNFGGIGIRIAWLVLGLAPPLLFVTGFIMWWTRVVRTRWIRGAHVRYGCELTRSRGTCRPSPQPIDVTCRRLASLFTRPTSCGKRQGPHRSLAIS